MQWIGVHQMLLALYRTRNDVVVAGLSLLLRTWKGSTISGIPRAKEILLNSLNKSLFPVLLLVMDAAAVSWHGPLNGLRITQWASQLKRITLMFLVMVPQESVMQLKKSLLLLISPLTSNSLQTKR